MLFKYTTELRTYFENLPINSDQSLPHSTVIENGRSKLFDFEYEIFDPAYKKIFETHFIRKFYMRQIGFETFGLFKFQLETWLMINMPYFNKIFESELIKYDPLINTKMDVTTTKRNDKKQDDSRTVSETRLIDGETQSTINRTESSNTEQTSSMNGSSESSAGKNEHGTVSDDNFDRQLESTTPDGRLSITATDGQGVIEYANNIKENTENNSKTTNVNGTTETAESSRVDSGSKGVSSVNDNTTDNTTSNVTQNDTKNDSFTSSINNLDEYVEHRFGKVGTQTYSKMINEYRSSLLRVENQIFNEMNELFMLVY